MVVANKTMLVSFLHTCQCNLPRAQDIIDATTTVPLVWRPDIPKSPVQTVQSYMEHSELLDNLDKCVHLYKSGLQTFIKHQVIVGAPGTDKTFIMLRSVAYAICQELNYVVTSLAAKRPAALAGKHLNALIHLPVQKNLLSIHCRE